MRLAVFTAFFATIVGVLGGLADSELRRTVRASSNKVLLMNDNNFHDILNGERDYHVVVMLSSDSPQINCLLCREFRPDYNVIASSWAKAYPDGYTAPANLDDDEVANKNIYFFHSEFTESKNFFQVFLLNNIPKVFYFPPSTKKGPNNFVDEMVDYQFFAGDHKQLLKTWIAETTGHSFDIYVPPDYTRMLTNAFVAFTVVMLVRKFFPQVVKIVTSRLLWSGLSLFAVLLLVTGYMFNQIRGVPYLRDNGESVEYISPSQQSQHGIETQILSFLYGLLSLMVIILVKKVPELTSPSVHFIAVVSVSLIVLVAYSIFLSVFGMKAYGYPYKFLNLI